MKYIQVETKNNELEFLDTTLSTITGTIGSIKEYPSAKSVWYTGIINGRVKTDNTDYQKYLRNHDIRFNVRAKKTLRQGQKVTLIGNVVKHYFDNSDAYSMSLETKYVQDNHFTFDTIKNLLTATSHNYSKSVDIDKLLEIYKMHGYSPMDTFIDMSKGEKSNIVSQITEESQFIIAQALRDDNNKLSEAIVVAELTPYYGKDNNYAKAIYQTYGFESMNSVKENPWEMLITISNMRLDRCDKVATKLGFSLDDPKRLRTLIVKATNDLITELGYTYLPFEYVDDLYNKYFSELTSYDAFIEQLEAEEKYIVKIDVGYQPSILHDAEHHIFESAEKFKDDEFEVDDPDFYFENVEKQEALLIPGFKYTDQQKEAIIKSLTSRMFLLTGGPGCGKTTVLKGILEAHFKAFNFHKHNVLAVSPTGKAAQRMFEQTGLPAQTVHKALNLQPGMVTVDTNKTARVMTNLGVKMIVIDEASMLGTELAGMLFDIAHKIPNCKLFIIGDANQLPSISPGQVFVDLLDQYESVVLTEVKRQDKDSDILTVANMVLNGEFPDREWFTDKKDVFFTEQTNTTIINTLVNGVLKPKINDKNGIQILSPYYNQSPGVDINYDTVPVLNHFTQEVYNPDKGYDFVDNSDKYNKYGQLLRIGDRVVSKVNLTENIVNGSIGRIVDISKTDSNTMNWTIVVDFNDNVFDKELDELSNVDYDNELVYQYPFEDWNNLELAYALTIHKSQGSEYNLVIIPLVRNAAFNTGFLNRNLLYTAITRAKHQIMFMGSNNSFKQVAQNERTTRQTGLQHLFEKVDKDD